MTEHRKQIRHFHEPGDLHELTFLCYSRSPLLTDDVWREKLCWSIDTAIDRWQFRLAAFVATDEGLRSPVFFEFIGGPKPPPVAPGDPRLDGQHALTEWVGPVGRGDAAP